MNGEATALKRFGANTAFASAQLRLKYPAACCGQVHFNRLNHLAKQDANHIGFANQVFGKPLALPKGS